MIQQTHCYGGIGIVDVQILTLERQNLGKQCHFTLQGTRKWTNQTKLERKELMKIK